MTTTLGALLTISMLASSASGQAYSEGFDGGSNDGAWEIWWNNFNTIESTGGNPGSYLRLNNLTGSSNCQFIEIFPTAWPAGFSGDWRAAGVASVGFDLNVMTGPALTAGLVTLIVGNDNGTPGNTADDCTVEFYSLQLPPGAPGWTPFDFAVPASDTTIPNNWSANGSCGASADAIWNFVMQDADYFRVKVDMDSNTFCAFSNWDAGVDNIRVETGLNATPLCYGDGSGTTCPCGNNGTTGAGCANSGSSGATLTAAGSTSVALDDLNLYMAGGPGPVPSIVFAGTVQVNGGNGNLFGDGLLCAGGAIKRLGVVILDGTGAGSWGPNLSPAGGWSAGDTRYLQGWYRDVIGPCGGGFNTSHALEVVFTP